MSTNPTVAASPSERPSLLRRFLRTVRGFLLWRHERGSWQYDVMVVLILVFVLLSPPRWFHDPALPPAQPEAEVLILRKSPQATHYRIRVSLLWQYGSEPNAAARALLAERHGKPFRVTNIVPVEDDAGAVVWYDVWVHDARE